MTSNHDDMLTSHHRFSTLEIIRQKLQHSMMISQKVTGEPSCIRVFLVVKIKIKNKQTLDLDLNLHVHETYMKLGCNIN